MIAVALQRIIDLWPSLPEDAQSTLSDLAEGAATSPDELELTAEEHVALDQSREEFARGDVLDKNQFRVAMDAIMRDLSPGA